MDSKRKKPRGKESLYKVIAKVGEGDQGGYRSVTYRTSNLISTFQFLVKTYPGFKWMNVIDRKTKLQVANFTIRNPPTTARIPSA